MISFNLICDNSHAFEAWFGSSDDFETQKKQGLITCPYCGSEAITKTLMTPNIGVKNNQKSDDQQQKHSVKMAPEMLAKYREMQAMIEKEYDDVGSDFAEEARKIHYGEVPERGIYGKTSEDEAKDLLDEGIAIARMPVLPKMN